jgi:pyruvate/2-oxoglutarate dehydrogenase complex dihydrolipoamide dehydrogenase (E3) component
MRHAVPLVGSTSAPTLDADRIMERVLTAIDGVYAFETPDALAQQGVEVAFGAAQFVDGDTIAIGDRHVSSRHFIVCTGPTRSSRRSLGWHRRRFLHTRTSFRSRRSRTACW